MQVLPQASLVICSCGFVSVDQMPEYISVYSPSVRSTQLSSVSRKGTEIPIAFRIPYVLTISPGVTCCASSFRLLVTLSARKDKYLYAIYTHKISEMSPSPWKQFNHLIMFLQQKSFVVLCAIMQGILGTIKKRVKNRRTEIAADQGLLPWRNTTS